MRNIVFLLLVGSAFSAFAGSRGLSVTYKDSLASSAEVAGEMQLYSGSYALVIGIDDYTNGWPRLSNAINDARKVATALEDKGFEVTLKTNLDAREMEIAFEDFFIDKGVDPNARLFVWYAGHGHTVAGEGYLIPSDGVTEADERNFKRKSLSLRRFSDFIRLANSKHVYTIFDSCFAGTIFNVARSAAPPAITRVTAEPVRQFLTSGDAGQTVSDDGTFANLFVEALDGKRPADLNRDGFVTAEELGGFMTNEVSNYTYNAQVPRHGKLRDPKFNRGDFVFQIGGYTAPPLKVGPAISQERAAPLPSPKFNPEDEFWAVIKDSDSAAEFEAYLRDYPGGRYASVARLKLARLKEMRRETAVADAGLGDVQVRFFESGFEAADKDERRYSDEFNKSSTRRVWVEIFADNLDKSGDHSHDVQWTWRGPFDENFIDGYVEADFVVKPEWNTTWIQRGWGWDEVGNWKAGTYEATVTIDGHTYVREFRIR